MEMAEYSCVCPWVIAKQVGFEGTSIKQATYPSGFASGKLVPVVMSLGLISHGTKLILETTALAISFPSHLSLINLIFAIVHVLVRTCLLELYRKYTKR